MAALTAADYRQIRQLLYRAGFGKEELKALPGLPSESQLLAAFQAIEDFWEANRATLKQSVDTALNRTTTNALARKIVLAWLTFKMAKGG